MENNSLEAVKRLLSEGRITQDAAEEIFPELKESEDERIRKKIINYFKCQSREEPSRKDIHNKWIAWLEKQGEKKVPINDFKAKDWYVSKVDGKIHDMTYNPADKVESKFKVGDWITNGIDVNKIIGIDIECENYLFENSISDISLADSINHIWTIQDAKDGDVLVYKDEISLYKHYIKTCTKRYTAFGGFVYYCCYDGEKLITNSLYSLSGEDKKDIYPATKEQRDKLEKAITDADYKWDAEKKELRKIEQNPAWSEEDERIRYAICDTLDRTDERIMEYNSQLTHQRVKDWLKSLKERYTWKPSKKQLEALEHSLGDYNIKIFEDRHEILTSLYQDLKKLKGK